MLKTSQKPETEPGDVGGLGALLLEIASDGWWQWHLDTDEIFFDPRFYAVTGYEPEDFSGSFGKWIVQVHPDDLPNALADLAVGREADKGFCQTQFRFRKKNGDSILNRIKGTIRQ